MGERDVIVQPVTITRMRKEGYYFIPGRDGREESRSSSSSWEGEERLGIQSRELAAVKQSF